MRLPWVVPLDVDGDAAMCERVYERLTGPGTGLPRARIAGPGRIDVMVLADGRDDALARVQGKIAPGRSVDEPDRSHLNIRDDLVK